MAEDKTKPTDGPIVIDVGAVLRAKTGRKHISRLVIKPLEKLIRQDKLNEMLATAYPRRGADFCRAVIDHLGITVNTEGMENLPPHDNPRVIIVSNHPLGGLDGLALIDFAARYYGREPLFVVNDLLMAVEPLAEVFVPVNKHGAQSRSTTGCIDNAMRSDRPVIIFPAGLCSRRRDGKIADLQWHKMFVHKAKEYSRTIIPLWFDARNSSTFYNFARMREAIGIKFNIEMTLLPGEIFKSSGKTFNIYIGKPVPPESLSADDRKEAAKIRQTVDNLKSTFIRK